MKKFEKISSLGQKKMSINWKLDVLMSSTRPEIAYRVNKLCKYMIDTRAGHWKWIVRVQSI